MFKCPVCEQPIDVLWGADSDHECGNCNNPITVIDDIPVLVKDLNAIQATFDTAKEEGRWEWYSEPQAPQLQGPYRHHVRKRINYVRSAISKFSQGRNEPIRALDIGCGDGTNLWWLSECVDELYGSDYNLLRLRRAAAVHGVKQVFLADILSYPVQDSSFDLIFFNHVLEHIPDAERALEEVRRILKPDGLLILGVPNEGAAFWQLAYRLQPHIRATTDHVHFFTAKSLKNLCVRSGLIVVEQKFLGWGPPHWQLDSMVRGFKFLDDLFEFLGKTLLPNQASSLYFLAKKSAVGSKIGTSQ